MIAARCGGVRVVGALRAQRPHRRVRLLRREAGLVRPARALADRGGRGPTSRSSSAATSTSRPPTTTSGTRAPATAGPTSRRRSARPSRGSWRWGLVDAYRRHAPEPGRYTWWDYRAGNVPQELRHAHRPPAGDGPARRSARSSAEIDREARKGKPIPPTTRRWSSTWTRRGVAFDAGLGLGRGAHRRAPRPLMLEAAHRADAGEAVRRAAGRRRLALRAQVGRLPRHRLQRRRRRLHPEPRPEAARPLFPGAARRAARGPARALRGGRGDRDRDATRASTSTSCSCACTPRPRGWRSWPRRRRRPSWPSTCSPSGDDDLRARPQAERRAALERAMAGANGRSTSRPARATARSRRTGSTASRARASMA